MLNRRNFLQHAIVALTSGATIGRAASSANILEQSLIFDAEHKASLPKGSRLRIVAKSGQVVPGSSYRWHAAPDGGACFATEKGGWIYVSNSEMSQGRGGVGALRFDAQTNVVDAYSILQNTSRNCAGGRSLWNTWLSCEENGEQGQVYECDPFGKKTARVLPALGSFNHEAVAMDPDTGIAYLTEDAKDGCLYRFIPLRLGDLSEGQLQVAVLQERNTLAWLPVLDPAAKQSPLRHQRPEAARFQGGEGIVYGNEKIFFTTKHDNRVWSLDLKSQQLTIEYDASLYLNPVLSGVDNIEVSPNGELLIAEDGGDMQIVALTTHGKALPLITLHEQDESEITGPAFSPDGSKLYFSSQRGFSGESEDGITYELSLP